MWKWIGISMLGLCFAFAVQAEEKVAEPAVPAPYSLTAKDVQAAVTQALTASGIGDHLAAVTSGLHPTVYEAQTPVTARITSLSADKASGRFQANLLVVSDTGTVFTAMPIAGRFQEMVTLPVLKRGVRPGDVIAQEDVDSLDFPLAFTRTDAVKDASQLVGQAASNTISPHRPIRSSELTSPAVLKKSALVQMIYRSGTLEIVTSGQALNQGAKGDVIQVKNLTSHHVVRAVVQDTNTVVAVPMGEAHAEAK